MEGQQQDPEVLAGLRAILNVYTEIVHTGGAVVVSGRVGQGPQVRVGQGPSKRQALGGAVGGAGRAGQGPQDHAPRLFFLI